MVLDLMVVVLHELMKFYNQYILNTWVHFQLPILGGGGGGSQQTHLLPLKFAIRF